MLLPYQSERQEMSPTSLVPMGSPTYSPPLFPTPLTFQGAAEVIAKTDTSFLLEEGNRRQGSGAQRRPMRS